MTGHLHGRRMNVLLDHLLAVDVAEFAALRSQAERARVTVNDLEPLVIELHVAPDMPAADLPGDVVSSAVSRNLDDPEAVDAMLWIDRSGYLSRIEVTWFGDEPPGLPAVEELMPATMPDFGD
jgi:hypothetical protein